MSEKRPETDAEILSHGERASLRRRGSRYSVDLASHIAECDKNYHLLLRLFPSIKEQDIAKLALMPEFGTTTVELHVLERSRYTSLIRLRQLPELSWGRSPNLKIRLYHDTKSAEVVEYQSQNRFHGVYEYPNSRMRQRDEKAQINTFLGEYLAICMAHGASLDSPLGHLDPSDRGAGS